MQNPPPPPPPGGGLTPPPSGASSPSSSAPPSPSRRASGRRTAVDPRAAAAGAVHASDVANPVVAATAHPAVAARPAAGGGGTVPNAAGPRAGPKVVPRPPLNPYLRIAIIRDETDAIVCPDPSHPGATKRIEVGRIAAAERMEEERKKGEEVGKLGTVDEPKANVQPKPSSDAKSDDQAEGTSKNKKEIPVPTITTVRRYDVDVPPDYPVPSSYVRNVCMDYDEAMDGNVEYNIDAEDERWWRNNLEFGPNSVAKIVLPGEKSKAGENGKVGNGGAAPNASTKKEGAEKEKPRGRKGGKFVKKSSSKKLLDAKDDPMETDSTHSDVSAPAAAPSHGYTVEQVLLGNPRYLHSRLSTPALLRRYNPKLPLHLMEKMIDLLEKATGFESIVTLQQAEALLAEKIPELTGIFGPLGERERRLVREDEERHLRRWIELPEEDTLPTLAPPVTLPQVIAKVYDHWVSKRSRLRKPLLRRYWPPTAASDTNPHQVFRQREKEKRRLRKKRQNDMEAYRKMRRLKVDFERVGVLCELIARREEAGRMLVELGNDYFEERLHGLTNTSGAPRRSQRLDQRAIERALNVPRYYDDGPIARQTRGGKKRKRSIHHHPGVHPHPAVGSDPGSRSPSPVPPAGAPPVPPKHPALAGLPPGMRPPPGMAPPPPPKNIVVAGHDGGLPAPNFLQPLATRESHPTTNWEEEVPAFPSYVNGRATQPPGSTSFRHRPRLGRGGRIIVDRVPCPSSHALGSGPRGPHMGFGDGPPPPTVVTYGTPMSSCGYDIAPLGADGPNYSINASPDKFGPGRSPPKRRDGRQLPVEDGKGTNAASAPKAPPATSLRDLMPKSLGNPALLSRRIEEICAMGLVEDYRTSTAPAPTASAPAASTKGGAAAAAPAVPLGEDMDEVLVKVEDWMEAPSAQRLYGTERFVIGPL